MPAKAALTKRTDTDKTESTVGDQATIPAATSRCHPNTADYDYDFFRLGRATSSPPQFCQRPCMAVLQSAQNVHS
jgi:hypothetical protein